MNRQSVNVLVRLVLSVALLVSLIALVDRKALVDAFLTMNVPVFLIGLALFFCAMGIWSVRWYLIVRASGEPTSLRQVFTTTLVGIFFSMFLPTLGSDVARMYELSSERGTNARVVSTVLLDRLIGLISLVIMALVGLVLGYQLVGNQDSRITLLIIGALVALGGGWLVFFNRSLMRRFSWLLKLPIIGRFEGSIRTLYQALYHLYSQPRLLASTLVVSFVMQVTEVASIICIARALNIQASILYFLIFVPMIWVVTMIPVSISGLGLREGAFWFFFSQVGVQSSEAIAMSLLYYSYRLIMGVLGGLIFLQTSVRQALGRRGSDDSEGKAAVTPSNAAGGR